jgi:hypothetical protein
MKTTMLRAVLSAALAVAALSHVPAQAANILNGTQSNGLYTNGLYTNGLYTNGLYTNGLVLNGIQINGIQINGFVVNGMKSNGTGLSTPSAALPQVEAIVLRDGRKLAVR